MPTYDYVCQACGHALEIIQSMMEAPKRKCPECGKPKLKRKIGIGAGLIFKGSGFYQTDYRSEAYKAAEKAETKPAETKPVESKPAQPAKPAETGEQGKHGKREKEKKEKPASE